MKESLVLSNANLGKTFEELVYSHLFKLNPFHGLRTPNLIKASRPTRSFSSQDLPFK